MTPANPRDKAAGALRVLHSAKEGRPSHSRELPGSQIVAAGLSGLELRRGDRIIEISCFNAYHNNT